jgi:hypothetical protein
MTMSDKSIFLLFVISLSLFSFYNNVFAETYAVNEIAKLIPSDPDVNNRFGESVAIDGDIAVIGVPSDDNNAGSVYIFSHISGVWQEQQKLTASDVQSGDRFGKSVAIEGDTLFIGAPGKNDSAGIVYVFVRDSSGIWNQQQKLIANDGFESDEFGRPIDIDKGTAVIGAVGDDLYAGAAYVFTYNGSSWNEHQKLVGSTPGWLEFFGSGIAIYNQTIVIGSYRDYIDGLDSGSAYVFSYDDGMWIEIQILLASDRDSASLFGICLDMNEDSIVVGAPQVYNDDGSYGASYIFRLIDGVWIEYQKLTDSDYDSDYNDSYGCPVAIEDDSIVIGNSSDDENGEDAGSAYLFTRNYGEWSEQLKMFASDAKDGDRLGAAVAISGTRIIAGAPFVDLPTGVEDGGTAYLFNADIGDNFTITDATWTYKNIKTGFGLLDVSGFSPYVRESITIVNGVTGNEVFYIRSKSDGTFTTTQKRGMFDYESPCSVQAVVDSDKSNVMPVANAPVNCIGPIDAH